MSPITSTLANASAYGYRTLASEAAGAFESIATATGDGSAASITFSSIPSTYKHLQLRVLVRDANSANSQYVFYFNAGATPTYGSHRLTGNGTAVTATGTASNAEMQYAAFTGAITTSTYGVAIIDVIDYASTTKNKTIRSMFGFDSNGAGTIGLSSAVWVATNAVTAITFYNANNNGLATGSVFSLYGIKG
jgi:hypothetical protein